jgi:hypothetical protein
VPDGLRTATACDLDTAGLQLLRRLAHKINHQQAVLELGVRDSHIVGEVEGLPERTVRDPLM